MTVAGFVLGAMIRGDTLLVPAHYHANLGGVTVAFMALLMVLLPVFGGTVPSAALVRFQPLMYGSGQMLFVLGLALAGLTGDATRKAYEVANTGLSTGQALGFLMAGVGGAVALLGGVVFVVTMLRAAVPSHRFVARRQRV